MAESQHAERPGGRGEAHREAAVLEPDRRGQNGLGQPHPAALPVSADPEAGPVMAQEVVLGKRHVGGLEYLAHAAPLRCAERSAVIRSGTSSIELRAETCQ